MTTPLLPSLRTAFSFLLITLALGCSSSGPSGHAASAKVGQSAPAFELGLLDGGQASLAGYAGKVVLLDFWATWCTPCHEQTRLLTPLYAELQGRGVEFLAVNSGEDEETVRRFVAKTPFAYPVALDPSDSMTAKLEILALPTLVILDRQGKISFFQEGITRPEALRQELAKAGL